MSDASCEICGRQDGELRRYGLAVEGKVLNLNPVLCVDHGASFLFRCGQVLGELIAEQRKNE